MGKKVFVAPVYGVELTDAVSEEFPLIRTLLISKEKLRRKRKYFGIPEQISRLPAFQRDLFFDTSETFAIVLHDDRVSDETIRNRSLGILHNELALLSLSCLQHKSRGEILAPTAMNPTGIWVDRYAINRVVENQMSGSLHIGALTFPHQLLTLDHRWKTFQRENFFFSLLKILCNQGRTRVAPSWRKDLLRACILVGSGQSCNDLAQAFLLNMIAFELLLTDSEDGKYLDILPKRVDAFIGWLADWKSDSFASKIQQVYKKRCEYVHQGIGQNITVEDLLFTDLLIFNIILNIVSFPKLFNRKSDLIGFSNKLEAEKVLGITRKSMGLKFRRITRSTEEIKKFFNA